MGHQCCSGEHSHDEECACGHDHREEGCACGHDYEHGHDHGGCGCGGEDHGHGHEGHSHVDPYAVVTATFTLGDVKWRVRRWGDPSGHPVVMLHGFMQSAASWDFIAPEVASQGRCVYALDLVGHGGSDAPSDPEAYSYEALADGVASFLENVACVDPSTGERRKAAVIGYSRGGRLALRLVETRADLLRGVLLESCGFGPVDEAARQAARERNEGWAARLREEGMEAFVAYWEDLPLFATQRERGLDERLRPERLANDAQAMAHIVERAGKHVMPLEQETIDALSFTWVPVAYVCGEEDASTGELAHKLHERGIEVHRAGTGHNVHLEAPMLYLGIVQDFLRSTELSGLGAILRTK